MQNRLANASSPYLRMHAGNPVAWQPWDDAALAQARGTDTPILLSIGYSACHWCHVMAHESFENPDIAAAMNRGFVNIKLDREERPDIDRVYQLAHQALTGRGGGWPLTVFLDPQTLSPFYLGTYFPPAPRHGLPGFPEVLQRVRAYFDTHRDQFREHGEALREWMQRAEAGSEDGMASAHAADEKALQRIGARFDPESGGSRGAPKFPRATELEWQLDLDGHGNATQMAHTTLARMASRGLQDHLGGGFFRYCVDADWTIPHFEKMLYDNAQLLPVYARVAASSAADAGARAIAAKAAHGIAEWLQRDMRAPNGAFYSAISADSEGEEGRFYLWTREQFRALLPESSLALAEQAFGLDRPPNFENRAWHLLRTAPLDNLAWQLGRTPESVAAEFDNIRRSLFETRAHREHPARDDKILTAWNALAIAGLARSARLLDDPHLADLAVRALAALRESTWIDGELFANAAAPAARIPGFLDDHAFLLDALLEVLQLDFQSRDLEWALALADALRDRFADPDGGGFWFSTPAHATPLARGRTWTDDALPNGNGVAIRSLLRLGHMVGDSSHLDVAGRALRAASGALQQYPEACTTLLRALREFDAPRTQIVVRCTHGQQDSWRTALRDALRDAGTDRDAVDAFVIPAESENLPGLLATRSAHGDRGCAFVCSGMTCQAPVDAPAELADALRAALAVRGPSEHHR